jgi:SAM-dependent methyltransferase
MSLHISCRLCKVTSPADIVSESVRDDPSKKIKVVRCLTCGFVQLFPIPSLQEYYQFYDLDMQARNLTEKIDIETWGLKSQFDTKRYLRYVSEASSNCKNKDLLDIGSGYGFFVDAAVQAGYDATGIDVSEARITFAKKNLNGSFIKGDITDEFVASHHKKYSIITLFSILEHVFDPTIFLERVLKLLTPQGYLIIEVPNLNDELLLHVKEYRSFFWQKAHLSYFDPGRLELTFLKAGIKTFTICGSQRYGLGNLLFWIKEKKPQLNSPDYYTNHPMLEPLEQLYRNDREKRLKSDTLISFIKK